MPYIKSDDGRREKLKLGARAENAGELNFQLFAYLREVGEMYNIVKMVSYVNEFLGLSPNYQRYNDMVGCLTCCQKELFRRTDFTCLVLTEIRDMYDQQIADYEDLKIKLNGDVI